VVRVPGAVAASERGYDFRYEWTDAEALALELASRYRDPSCVRLQRVPGMPHHLAEPPGVEPAPQNAHAVAVDAAFTAWFTEHLTCPGKVI